MKTRDTQLLTILFQLADIQIKKYVKLTQIGVGPDASMNAHLVCDEVDELLEFAQELTAKAERGMIDDETYGKIFSQIKFYVDLEYLRGTAAWLIDKNNVHNTEYDRVQLQVQQLEQLAQTAELKLPPPQAVTEKQKQCEHDSYAIAHLITKSALILAEDTEAEMKNELPEHALAIMKRHAAKGGRYRRPGIRKEIDEYHKICEGFFKASSLSREKSTAVLRRTGAETRATEHQRRLDDLLGHFDKLASPEAQSKNIKWYEIGNAKGGERVRPSPNRTTCRCSSSFFKTATWTLAGVGTAALAAVAMTYR